MLKKPILINLLILSLLITPIPFVKTNQVQAFSGQVIQHGAVGTDVIELQERLKHLGFFTGTVDGVFGWRTYWALRNFQYEFGLPIDGMAGPNTKAKLVKASKNYKAGNNSAAKPNAKPQAPAKKPTAANTPAGFSQNDIRLMANAVHGESRGEPYIGQVAVAAVILNRVQSASFPNTVSGVIFEPGAFTAVADGQIWLTPNETSKKAVIDAINGWDPTGEALYYFNPATATSGWIWGRPQIKKIGQHIFCK
ncbi:MULTISPECIES: spore cortex-lytic enzyme [Neobacillus]|uniref:Spore cortex-lytic enzyme n=1 Tax=Neobacillus rhizophilus TaxID=2833579 RepID=A0A942UAT4_9BACI|nr:MULTISPECIES: spore cortex-lytic enzyme [Neobacillus]MBS4215837.1 spore cortex-lytic enzyme [Neobacillus rhizophilus]MBU8916265.1 spore cortex-lytic enzyme [Bacillus sp. FJAT-29953]